MSVLATAYINKARNDLMKAGAEAFGVSAKFVTVQITARANGQWRVCVWHKSGEDRSEVVARAPSLIDALTKARDMAQRGEVRTR